VSDTVPFRLDPATGVPFYRQIIDQVTLAVADGRLSPGIQLPTVRQLAVDLSVNLNTVARAYREMEIRGLVTTQQGTGTFVAHRKPERKGAERRKALDAFVRQLLAHAAARGFTPEEIAGVLAERSAEPGRRTP